jgi:hypothetical protein
MPFNEKIHKALARRYQMEVNSLTEVPGMTPDNPQYAEATRKLADTNRVLNEHYSSQRQTDENGKLTEDAVGASPNTVGDPVGTRGSYNFHFEPSVAEVRRAYDADPTLLQRLAPDWVGIAEPEREEPVYDVMMGTQVGANRVPAVSHLDRMDESSTPYTAYTEHLWEERSKEAEASGTPLQRYSKVKLREQPLQYATGGLQYNIERRLAPAAFGYADSFSAGQASPLYDAGKDLLDYERGRFGETPAHTQDVTDPTTGQVVGENTVRQEAFGDIPSSQEVISRSPGSYIAGNIAGYASKVNPSNVVAEAAIKKLGYEGANTLGKAGISAAVGGGINAAEGGIGAAARATQQGLPWDEVASQAGGEAAMGAATGVLGGGLFDTAAQTFGLMRQGIRERPGIQGNIKALEEAGGRSDVVRGVVPPPEVQRHVEAAARPGAIGSAAAQAAEEVAPHIQQNFEVQQTDLQRQIADEKNAYFNHPAYSQQTVSGQPAIQGLADMASQGWKRGPVSGAPMNIDPEKIDRLGNVIRTYSEAKVVPAQQASAVAAEMNGVQLDGELGNRIFGLDAERAAPPGYVVIAVPLPFSARDITDLEELIDAELKMASAKGSNNDPIWTNLNRSIKQMRDEFPAFEDEAGNLVAPPPEERTSQPFGQAGDLPPPEGRATVLPKPIPIEGQQAATPEAQPGIGAEPVLPRNPFDPRLPTSREAALQPMPAPRGVEATQRRPEGLMGVGPGQPDLPSNPFDPRLPVSQESLNPRPMAAQPTVGVTGGEYARPDVVPPEAKPGIGQFRRRHGVDTEALNPQPTKAIQGGEYSKPPAIEPEAPTPPETKRGMPRTEQPPVEPIDQLAGNKLAMKLEEPATGYQGGESLPAPTAKEWTDSTKETGEWYDDIVAPGAPARSAEAKRMEDLSSQMRGDDESRAFEEAKSQIDNINKRLGPLEPEQREKMLIDVLKERLGREVTREDLIKAGLITGAGVAAVTSDDDETGAAVAAVGALGAVAAGGPMQTKGANGKAKTRFAQELLAYNSSDAAVEVLDELGGYIQPSSLQKKHVLTAVKNIINEKLDPSEAEHLIASIDEYAKNPPDAGKPQPKAKTYSSDVDQEAYSERREIGESLRLGPRFKGDAYDADAVLKKAKRELPPPPPIEVPYKETNDGGPSFRNPSPEIRRLEIASKRKFDELDGDEQHAVHTWLGNSRIMREEQRNGIPLYTTGPKAPAFESAVDKLTVRNPTKHGMLYRRFHASDPRELAELLSGDYFEVGASMSSGYRPLETFGPHELRFKKVDQAGSLLGVNASESEMIIPKGGRFKITNRYFNKKTGGYVFELEEIPLTQENLLREVGYLAVPFAVGAAVDEATDGDGEAVAAGAIIGGGGKKARSIEATLDDGTKVKGFSALRRKQHERVNALETNKQRAGAGSDKTIRERVMNFNLRDDMIYDKSLMEEAKKVGKEKELRTAAATNVYGDLKREANFGGSRGAIQGTANALGLRLDKPLEYLSGAARNPFAREPQSLGGQVQRDYLEDPARRLLNLSGGRAGYRFDPANEALAELIRQALFDQQKEEEKR